MSSTGLPSASGGQKALPILRLMSSGMSWIRMPRVGIALGHLATLTGSMRFASLETREQGGVHGDRLLPPQLVRGLPGQHVRPPLVHAGVGHVQVHGEDVRRLHAAGRASCEESTSASSSVRPMMVMARLTRMSEEAFPMLMTFSQ